jgi:hypothetical protein
VIEMNESRKQFEEKIQHSYGEDYLVVNDDGDYANWITADLWEFWQASRAAIEIEIPELKMLKDYLREVSLREREDILVGCKLEFHRKLKELGIKIKGA